MFKHRYSVGLLLGCALIASALLAGSATAMQSTQQETVKLGFITKFPVDFFFTLQNAAKKWDKAPPGATVISRREERNR